MRKMFQGFKDFIMRGNVVDLAVGIVIGAAFTSVVTALTNGFLQPVIRVLGGGSGVGAGKVSIGRGQYLDWSAFVNAVINFLIVAFCIFLMIKGMNSMRKKQEAAPAPPAPPSDEVLLLREIRDALRSK